MRVKVVMRPDTQSCSQCGLEASKPEAAYFTEQNGQRGTVLIVDLPDPSKIPVLAEPWFLTFQADVEFVLP
jgi:hypothetical protein